MTSEHVSDLFMLIQKRAILHGSNFNFTSEAYLMNRPFPTRSKSSISDWNLFLEKSFKTGPTSCASDCCVGSKKRIFLCTSCTKTTFIRWKFSDKSLIELVSLSPKLDRAKTEKLFCCCAYNFRRSYQYFFLRFSFVFWFCVSFFCGYVRSKYLVN